MSIFGECYKELDRSIVKENAAIFSALTAGLLKAAGTTDAWVITSGLNCGVNKLVGRAVGNNRSFINAIPTIGLVPWGAVRDSEDLVCAEGYFPASYITYVMSSAAQRELALESNHTHFLLFDKGVYNCFYKADMAKKRIDIELYMVNIANAQLVSIMIAGDLASLREVRRRVETKKSVVIMKGTGRMADVICVAFEGILDYQKRSAAKSKSFYRRQSTWHGNEHKLFEDATGAILKALRATFPSRKNQNFEQQMNHIRCLFKCQEYITICSCDVDDVDQVILSGLIRSMGAEEREDETDGRDTDNTQMAFHQLRLAIFWNRADLAVESIFKKLKFSDHLMDELLYLALKNNRVDFVRKFINKGSSLSIFLTHSRFLELLNDIPKGSFLRRLLTIRRKHRNRMRLKCIKKIGFNKRMFTFKHFAAVIYKISDGVYQCSINRRKVVGRVGDIRLSVASIQSHFQDPEVLLVLLCVLDQRHKMALLLWEQSKSPAMLALVACHIYKWMAKMESSFIEITPEMKPVLLKNASEFQSLAYRIVDEAAKNYPVKWVDSLITHQYYNWGGKTLLQVGDFIDGHYFISHTAIQEYVTKQWMGMLEPDMTNWGILLSIPFPLLASFRKLTASERRNKLISKEIDELERKKMAFISKTAGKASEHGEEANKRLNLVQRFYYFYSAPVVKFWMHQLMNLILIVSFVLALLAKPKFLAERLSQWELVVYLWYFSTISVEIRQIYHGCPSTVIGKLKNYLSNSYNRFDLCSLLLILLATICRYSHLLQTILWDSKNAPEITPLGSVDHSSPPKLDEALFRVFFSFAFILMCARIMQFMQISPKLGPKVVMVGSMLMDLVFFLSLLLTALLLFGVSTQSLINPTKDNFNFDTMFRLFWRPYLNMFGELDLDTLKEDINEGYCQLEQMYNTSLSCTDAKEKYDCAADPFCNINRYLVYILLAVFMMLAAVMLMNLLVAVFTFTYDQINANSATLWSFQRYQLVEEFRLRSALPIPFNTIVQLGFFVRWVYRKCCCGRLDYKIRRQAFKYCHDHEHEQIALLEAECRRNLLEKLKKVTEIKIVHEGVQHCAANVNQLAASFDGLQKSVQGILDQTVNKLYGSVLEVDGMEIGNEDELTYPDTDIIRGFVPGKYRSWDVVYADYLPSTFTQKHESESDIDPGRVAYNTGEKYSYCGIYEVQNSLPLNPNGRTGVMGRGSLEKWGPNHLAVPVITRLNASKLEVLIYHDEDISALPELNCTYSKIMILPDDILSIFKSCCHDNKSCCHDNKSHVGGAGNSDSEDEENSTFKLFDRGILLERGYLYSSYNTDNAWFEIISYNYHDYDNELNGDLQATTYEWADAREIRFARQQHRDLVNRVRILRS